MGCRRLLVLKSWDVIEPDMMVTSDKRRRHTNCDAPSSNTPSAFSAVGIGRASMLEGLGYSESDGEALRIFHIHVQLSSLAPVLLSPVMLCCVMLMRSIDEMMQSDMPPSYQQYPSTPCCR